jgi:hypothetical protein
LCVERGRKIRAGGIIAKTLWEATPFVRIREKLARSVGRRSDVLSVESPGR